MKSKKVVVVKKDPENKIPVEIFEQAIVDVSEGFKKLSQSRMTQRAVVVLIQDALGAAKIPKTDIAKVLGAARDLERVYLK